MLDDIKKSCKNLTSYLINDPVGETILVVGSYGMLNYSPLFLPVVVFGFAHTRRMLKRRKDIGALISNNGWQGSKLEQQTARSWCSRQVIRAYAWSRGEYKKFKEFWRCLRIE